MHPHSPYELAGQMSFAHSSPGAGDGIDDFYDDAQSQWAGAETSSYVGASHSYTTGPVFPSAAILTPISLPDTSFSQTRPSPVLSHHSQEFQYNIPEPRAQGLGITAPFPSDFPRTVTAGPSRTIGDIGYNSREAAPSPQPPQPKRARLSTSRPATRDAPVTILPHPEGLQRLEQERRQEYVEPPLQRPRVPVRSRRDPQAEEEDSFVERLREQKLAWKVIRELYRERFNKDASEARLQMRMLRRRKERLARWDENDIQLLMKARDDWENEKYNWIAQRIAELGATKAFTALECEGELRYLDSLDSDHDDNPYSSPSRKRKHVESEE